MTRLLAIFTLALFLPLPAFADLIMVGGGSGGVEEESLTQVDPPAHVTLQTPTFHSVGLIWDPDTDDADHDAVLSVEYRQAGDAFSDALDLIRSDWAPYYNTETYAVQDEFGGSLLFLTPGTRYQIRLSYDDPDNADSEDGNTYTFTADTRAIPVKPIGGNTYYVTTGAGSGNAGTQGDPFEGLAEAQAAAAPGDIFLIGAGTYADFTLTVDGAEDNYIVWQEDPDDTGAVMRGFRVSADHLWIEGLTFTWDGSGSSFIDTSAIHIQSGDVGADDIVITANTITCGYLHGVFDTYGTSRWTVMDNTICGSEAADVGGGPSGGFTGEGVQLNMSGTSSGHVVAYNNITRVSDGISLIGNAGDDVYGNQIYDLADDCVEPDRSLANIRIWGNRLHYAAGHILSFQPQSAGPWYILYNQLASGGIELLKYRVQDRIVFVNNTFMGRSLSGHNWMYSYARNNIWARQAANIFNSTDNYGDSGCTPPNCIYRPSVYVAGWYTDIDYNGYDRGGSGNFFNWDDNATGYTSLATWASAVGVDDNSIEVDADAIFDDNTIDPDISLELASGTNAAVDAGDVVPNLSDFYEGSAPDLGAHERDATSLHYGPRNIGVELNLRTEYWTKH